tara:strand:+ start:236 stop:445 length:210 start_codon:yes stop_codon:yes gene_type:complete
VSCIFPLLGEGNIRYLHKLKVWYFRRECGASQFSLCIQLLPHTLTKEVIRMPKGYGYGKKKPLKKPKKK